ncbi:hypothetical protein [Niabella hibiscisoli]|uniref:hypothetical protein n=1 Tax=Niabella hibiscisoli TaxID=1825928 RepID=UPI001F10924E|nr:hypothetical protein [Niabella hibiscisoli]MCH5720399.1 hypothetical protein [Niabella hibiscisoli]
MYKIQPGFPEKKGVKYLSYSGEQFFKLIFEKISDRIIDDALNNRTSLNHSESFLQSQDIYVDYDTSKGQREIAKAGSISGKGKQIIQMTFTDEGIHQQIQSLIKGIGTSKVSIPAEHLISIITTINGINIPLFKDGVSIELFKEPNRKGNFDIRFEDGLEINDLPYEINKSSDLIEIKINIKTGILTVSFNPQNDRPDEMPITLNFKHNQICSNTLDEINAFHLLNNFAGAKPFTIFAEGKKSRFHLRSAKDIIDNAANLLQHFKNLNFIEQRFNIKFKNLKFSDQTTHNIEVVKNLLEQIDGKEKLFAKRGELYALESDNSAAYDKENLEILFGKKSFEIPTYTETFYNLFDQKISVGYLYIRVINAVFKNKEDV